MSLLYDRRPQLGANPGVHGLIIGVSEYPFLAGGTHPVADAWGMDQLTSAAATAHKMFEWLKSAELPLPLATCRVLLAPSPAEAHLAGLTAAPALANVMTEANEWRNDAATHRENITFFYFAGHGVQRNKEDAVLCLQDFRKPPAPALTHAVDLATIRAGMSPSGTRPNIASTQFYFVDACRVQPAQFARFQPLQTSAVFDIDLDGQDDRCSPVFYASVSNHVAGAIPGVQTLFSKALLECLGGAAGDSLGEDAAGNPRWGVTLESLNQALRLEVDAINQQLGGDQTFTTGGQFKPAVIALLPNPPDVDVLIQVDPEAACEVMRIRVSGDDGVVLVEMPPPVTHPVKQRLPAGLYSIALQFNPPAPPYADRMRFKEARAPRSDWKVKVV